MGPTTSRPGATERRLPPVRRRTTFSRYGRMAAGLSATVLSTVVLTTGALTLAAPAQPALASSVTLYAYAHGGATSPASCPMTNKRAQQCSLGQALAKAAGGDDIALATSGRTGDYVGNWDVDTAGTAATAPLSITPAAGRDRACPRRQPRAECRLSNSRLATGQCSQSGRKCTLDIEGVTIRHADNTTTAGLGGAIENIHGGTVTCRTATFLDDYAYADGGAIDNADITRHGHPYRVWVSRSRAITPRTTTAAPSPTPTLSAMGAVTVSSSTFFGQ